MPKAATRTPATSTGRSGRSAIGARASGRSRAVRLVLDAQLAEAHVGVDGQLRRPGRGAVEVLPVVVGATGRAVEDLRRTAGDVSGARHADAVRHQDLGLADADLQVDAVVARPELGVAG